MNPRRVIATLFVFASACQTPSAVQPGPGDSPVKVLASVDNSAARRERLRANLIATYPPLGDLELQLGSFKALNDEMDQVEMRLQTPRGEQRQTILISKDSSQAFLVMEGPIDVSRSVEQLAKEQRERRAKIVASLQTATRAWPARGPNEAAVTVVEFSDFQCPFCERAYHTMEELLDKYPTQVRLVFMPFPLPFHDWARDASIYAACVAAADAQAYWKLYDGYFVAQHEITAANLSERSEQLLQGSDAGLAALRACSAEAGGETRAQAEAAVDAAMKIGAEHGVEGTPGFFVNGQFLGGAQPLDVFAKTIEQALAERPAN